MYMCFVKFRHFDVTVGYIHCLTMLWGYMARIGDTPRCLLSSLLGEISVSELRLSCLCPYRRCHQGDGGWVAFCLCTRHVACRVRCAFSLDGLSSRNVGKNCGLSAVGPDGGRSRCALTVPFPFVGVDANLGGRCSDEPLLVPVGSILQVGRSGFFSLT